MAASGQDSSLFGTTLANLLVLTEWYIRFGRWEMAASSSPSSSLFQSSIRVNATDADLGENSMRELQ